MTQPDLPAEPVDNAPAPAEPDGGQQHDGPSFDPSTLPPEAQTWLKGEIERAGFKARDNARRSAAEKAAADARTATLAEVAQKLGFGETEEPWTPEQFEGALEEASSSAFRASVEGQMYRLAGRVGVDVDALLDSNSAMDDFIDALDEDENVTEYAPRSKEFAEAVERAMKTAAEKNPRLRSGNGPRPDPSQGARGAAAPARPTSLGDAIAQELAQRAAQRR